MPLFDMFGGPVRLSYVELLRMFSDWRTLGFISLIAVALFGADPHGYRGHMPMAYAFLIWQVSAAALVLIKLVTFAGISAATARHPNLRVWLPLFSCFEFTLALQVLLLLEKPMLDDNYSFDVWASYPYMTTTMLILELLYIRFIMASVVVPARERFTPTTLIPDVPMIEVGGRRLRLDNVRHISSEEHYVRVQTRTEDVLARAKLSDLVDPLCPTAGVRTHRSWWVSRYAEPVLVRVDGKMVVETGSTRIPVSRSRSKDVQDWFDCQMNWGRGG